MTLLSRITGPADLKRLLIGTLHILAQEITCVATTAVLKRLATTHREKATPRSKG